ncbi:MAG: hypothetical protein ACKO40_12145 [Planctomycetaceae bacterium]
MLWIVLVAIAVMPRSAPAIDYLYPFFASTDNQASEGVRRYDSSSVLMACSYTASGSATQGMWWLGSLTTGSGTPYQVLPQFTGQTVTTSLYYGPNTAFANPTLGSGTIQIVGSYKYAEAADPNVNQGLLYTGPLSGVGGTWTQLSVPSNLTTGTVANTVPHSVMGEVVVGNYELAGVPASGNAFLYNTTSGSYTIFSLGGVQNLTSAYGVWQNSADSYTIVGGSQIGGINKAYILDYTLSTGSFGAPTYFAPRGESVTILSHFEGVSGLAAGSYALIGMTVDSGSNPIGVDYVVATRTGDGSFSRGDWVPLSVPGSASTTGNTVIDNFAIGVYTTSTSAGTSAYVATVPEPAAAGLAVVGLVVFAAIRARRHASEAANRPA